MPLNEISFFQNVILVVVNMNNGTNNVINIKITFFIYDSKYYY